MARIDEFIAGYIEAAVNDAKPDRIRQRALDLGERAHPIDFDMDGDVGERMMNDAARFYDSHWKTIENLIKRSAKGTRAWTWAYAGELFYRARNNMPHSFWPERPRRNDREAEETDGQTLKLDSAAAAKDSFHLKIGYNGHIHL